MRWLAFCNRWLLHLSILS